MPDTILVAGHALRLNGAAVYTKLEIRILAVGLWLEHPGHDERAILSAGLRRRYTTHFFHGVSSRRVRDEWRKGLEANTPEAGAQVHDQFRTLGGWIPDFRPGDEITVTYLPGLGSTVEVIRARKGVLAGKAFADAYFACALAPRPGLGARFKGRLLGAWSKRRRTPLSESPPRCRHPHRRPHERALARRVPTAVTAAADSARRLA